jgi:cyanate permease
VDRCGGGDRAWVEPAADPHDDRPIAGGDSRGYLAAFVQGIGFIITGVIPYAVGWLREVTGGFQMPWLMLIAIVIASIATTLRFAPSGYARAIGPV